MQWSLLPPLTFACHEVTVGAALESAYEVAGDTVDYAVDPGWARVAVLDGMGHGLQAAQLASLAVAAYRNARRSDRRLTETAQFDGQVGICRSSQPGSHQFAGLNTCISAGTSTVRQQEGADRDGDGQADAEFGDDSVSAEDERSEDADHDQGGGGDDSPGFGLAQTDGPRNVQGALRVRQGDVHDGGVEHDQQGRRDDHRPAPATGADRPLPCRPAWRSAPLGVQPGRRRY